MEYIPEQITSIVTIPYPTPSKITLNNGTTWFIEINKDGIIFNREEFPHVEADEFARAFFEVLERGYDVTFHKRKEYEKPTC